MNKTTLLLLPLALAISFSGCADSGASQSSRASAGHTQREKPEFDRSTPPKIGMSREQVYALYGEPKFKNQSPRGEIWNYTFDMWKFHIPYYNMAAKMKTGTVTFNAAGRVTDYQWGQSRSAFMMGM